MTEISDAEIGKIVREVTGSGCHLEAKQDKEGNIIMLRVEKKILCKISNKCPNLGHEERAEV